MSFVDDMMNQNSSNNNNNTQNTQQNIPHAPSGLDVDILESIDATLKEILRNTSGMSQSDARNNMPGRRYGQGNGNNKWQVDRNKRNKGPRGGNGLTDDFEAGMREALLESVLGSGFRDKMEGALGAFAESLGTNVQDLGLELGKRFGKDILQNTKFGQNLTNNIKNKGGELLKSQGSKMLGRMQAYDAKHGSNYAQQAVNAANTIKHGWSNPKSDESASNANTHSEPQSSSNEPSIADSLKSQAEEQIKEKVKDKAKEKLSDAAKKAMSKGASSAASTAASTAGTAATSAGTAAAGTAATTAGAATAGTAGATTAAAGTAAAGGSMAGAGLAALGPYALAIVAAIVVIKGLAEAMGPAIEGFKALTEGMSNAANRYKESRKKNLEYEKQRIKDDYEAIVKEPFEILKQAAQEWYDVWDNQLRTINATQGYNKDDLADLMGSFATRLRNEGLTDVVSSADITENLANVLKSGLSGKVAEEFAYLATKLNAAVPTQDFFTYAETYASLAANAIKDGKSESEAIAYANKQMEEFASNVLYASRQLSGGFSTGLKDAQSLFQSSVQIATTAKTGNASAISGVLTSIAATVGAIAPDLSSDIVSAVVKTATGGNASEIVALRSLAGVNASNTEFLRLLAQDPQKIFTDLFTNLAKMQNMSNDNFMEVAEGLSSVFGLSIDAFARVPFDQLADSISAMNITNAALNENMQLLASGETTTTAEQLKNRQITQYMIENGLAYVLDNEVSRSIQEHMWDEQLARELMEASYAVELQGSALEFLEGISQTVQNIIDFLNPFSFLKKIANVVGTSAEGAAQRADVAQLLALSKVGKGNAKSLSNLLTTNSDLNLVDNYINMIGGKSMYGAVSNRLAAFNTATNLLSMPTMQALSGLGNTLSGLVTSVSNRGVSSGPSSQYAWATVGKSVASALSNTPYKGIGGVTSGDSSSSGSTAAAIASQSNSRMQSYIDAIGKYVEDDKTFEQWKSAASSYGISDFEQAIEDFGVTEAQLKGQFSAEEASKASKHQHERELQEDEFWKQSIAFYTDTQVAWRQELNTALKTQIDNQLIMHELITTGNTYLSSIQTKQNKWFTDWTDYFVNSKIYNDAFNASDVDAIKSAQKEADSGALATALAEALTANTLDLKDPQLQTNVLLAKILLVAEQLLQQGASSGSSGMSLATTFAALGLGLTE